MKIYDRTVFFPNKQVFCPVYLIYLRPRQKEHEVGWLGKWGELGRAREGKGIYHLKKLNGHDCLTSLSLLESSQPHWDCPRRGQDKVTHPAPVPLTGDSAWPGLLPFFSLHCICYEEFSNLWCSHHEEGLWQTWGNTGQWASQLPVTKQGTVWLAVGREHWLWLTVWVVPD